MTTRRASAARAASQRGAVERGGGGKALRRWRAGPTRGTGRKGGEGDRGGGGGVGAGPRRRGNGGERRDTDAAGTMAVVEPAPFASAWRGGNGSRPRR